MVGQDSKKSWQLENTAQTPYKNRTIVNQVEEPCMKGVNHLLTMQRLYGWHSLDLYHSDLASSKFSQSLSVGSPDES